MEHYQVLKLSIVYNTTVKHLYKKGFTLIELLLVIAVVSLFSSIILSYLNSARISAADNAIKEDMRSIATSAELEYATLGSSYNNTGMAVTSSTCSTLGSSVVVGTILQNSSIKDAIKHIVAINGRQDIYCNIAADGMTYNMTFPLSVSTGYSLYLDSTSNFVAGKSSSAINSSFSTYILNSICASNCNTNFDFNKDGKIGSADRLILLSISTQTQSYFNNIYNGLTAETIAKIGTNVSVGSAFDPDLTGNVSTTDLFMIQAMILSQRN